MMYNIGIISRAQRYKNMYNILICFLKFILKNRTILNKYMRLNRTIPVYINTLGASVKEIKTVTGNKIIPKD